MHENKIDTQPTLNGGSICLRPLKQSDFEGLYEIAKDPKIWEQHPAKDRFKLEVFKDYFDGAIKSQGAFLILNSESNAIIGCTRFYDVKCDSLKIGYTFIGRQYWGTNTNYEVKKLMLDYAFNYCPEVFFEVGAQNFRSRKAMEKLGANLVTETNLDGKAYCIYRLKRGELKGKL